MDSKKAETFISSLRQIDIAPYLHYWSTLVPLTKREHWLRWIFAFMSIHTSWRNNVKGFNAIAALPTDFTRKQLIKAIVSAGVGLHAMRVQGVWEFTNAFREDTVRFIPKPGESMACCRDRLALSLYGIGMAKTSFVFEMLYPATCGVVCLDTHILRLYGWGKGTPKLSVYHEMEDHWRKTCHAYSVPLPIARHVYWDRLQGEPDNRYWAWCLERQSCSAELKGVRHAPNVWIPHGAVAA
jgi:hypothetical protein